jgi:hypothetical protein
VREDKINSFLDSLNSANPRSADGISTEKSCREKKGRPRRKWEFKLSTDQQAGRRVGLVITSYSRPEYLPYAVRMTHRFMPGDPHLSYDWRPRLLLLELEPVLVNATINRKNLMPSPRRYETLPFCSNPLTNKSKSESAGVSRDKLSRWSWRQGYDDVMVIIAEA